MCSGSASAALFDAFMHPLEVFALRRRRRRLIARAAGRVLEIGCGSGANLPFYRWRGIEQITLIDPVIPPRVRNYAFPVPARVEEMSVESLPFADGSFDTIVFTLVFCSVVDSHAGLAEAYRVLAPAGRVCFIEHVLPPSPRMHAPMHVINPFWRRFSSGCNITRQTGEALIDAGFVMDELERFGGGFAIAGIARRP